MQNISQPQPISNVINLQRNPSGTTQQAPLKDTTEIINPRIDELFTKLGASLMGRFTASFGVGKSLLTAKKVWQESLAPYSDKELAQAANDAVDFPGQTIFTLGEFKKICEAV